MSGTAYSTLKAGWHLDRMKDLRDHGHTTPIEIQLILSDFCNHDCHFCAYRASNGLSAERFVEIKDGKRNHNPNRMMDTSKALEILHDAEDVGVKSIIFTGGGEPSAHPDHLQVYYHALKLGLQCSLNTNGVIFKKGWENVLPAFTYVRFSVDAATADEYATIRNCPKSHYPKMLGNLTALRDEVDRRKSDCVVGTGYVVTPDNYERLGLGVKRLRDAGAHYVRIAAMQSTEGYSAYGGKWDEARQAAKECADLSENGFKVYDLMDGVVGERPDYTFCGFQHLVVYIGANLECYRCCYTAYTNHGLVGTLKDKTLKQYIETRELEPFDAKSCDVCPLNEKNRVIDYLTQKDPLHVNFV